MANNARLRGLLWAALCTGVALVSSGCKPRASGNSTKPAAAPATRLEVTTEAPPSAKAVLASPDAVAQMRATVEAIRMVRRWAEAQRHGDLDAYLSFYAHDGFKGVKRTPKGQARSYDYSAWAKDRASMVRQHPHVTTFGTQVSPPAPDGSGTASEFVEVSFEQTFILRSFQDHGEKRMRLRRAHGDGLQIVEEEQLSSHPGLPSENTAPPPFTHKMGSVERIAIHTIPGDPRESGGASEAVTLLVLTGPRDTAVVHLDADVPLAERFFEQSSLILRGFHAGASTAFRIRREESTLSIDVQFGDEEADEPGAFLPYARVGTTTPAPVNLICVEGNSKVTAAPQPCLPANPKL